MGYWLEPRWNLACEWYAFALAWLIVIILTYVLPLGWLTRIHPSLGIWRLWSLRLRVMMHAKCSLEKAEAENRLGWEEGAIDNPKIEKRYSRRFARALGIEDC